MTLADAYLTPDILRPRRVSRRRARLIDRHQDSSPRQKKPRTRETCVYPTNLSQLVTASLIKEKKKAGSLHMSKDHRRRYVEERLRHTFT